MVEGRAATKITAVLAALPIMAACGFGPEAEAGQTSVAAQVNSAAETIVVTVRARGTEAGGEWPEMAVLVNGEMTSPPTVEVTNPEFRDFELTAPRPDTEPVIEVVYLNDGNVGDRDRNLFIDRVGVADLVVQSEDPRVTVDWGSGEGAFDGYLTAPGQYALWHNGSLRFEMRPEPPPPIIVAPRDRAAEVLYTQDFSAGALDEANWDVYDSVGNDGWGLRRPSAVDVVPSPDATGGHLLRITATMGTGDAEGLLVSGGLSLEGYNQVYGRYTIRVRTDADPDRVTTGVALLWPESNVWPRDGEIDFYEAWRDRITRTPVELSNHHAIDGVHVSEMVPLVTPSGELADGTRWHTYVLDWRPDYLAVSVDGGPPAVVTTDPAAIPSTPMYLAVQLDAWEAPYDPGHQPVISAPVSLWVDHLTVETYPGLSRLGG